MSPKSDDLYTPVSNGHDLSHTPSNTHINISSELHHTPQTVNMDPSPNSILPEPPQPPPPDTPSDSSDNSVASCDESLLVSDDKTSEAEHASHLKEQTTPEDNVIDAKIREVANDLHSVHETLHEMTEDMKDFRSKGFITCKDDKT